MRSIRRTLQNVKCSCCGEERDDSLVASLRADPTVHVCRDCIGGLNERAGGIDVTPTLPVADMADAIRFCESAGFEVHAYDDGFAFVHFNGQSVFDLDLIAGMDPTTNHAGCYIITADADAWHTRLVAAGLPVTAIEDRPWGMREFTLTGPAGSNIRIGSTASPPS
ncbi:MAG: bleomycin resistance protein [Ilumatobacteraceae bacterium]|nr:bleomycin resistance protein [Ilumatobacteraceae bacterium]